MKIQNQSIIRCIDFPSGTWYYYVVLDKTARWLILSAKNCYLPRQQELAQDWYIDWGVRYWIPRGENVSAVASRRVLRAASINPANPGLSDGNRRRRVSRLSQRRVMTDFARCSIRIVRLGKIYARAHIGLL